MSEKEPTSWEKREAEAMEIARHNHVANMAELADAKRHRAAMEAQNAQYIASVLAEHANVAAHRAHCEGIDKERFMIDVARQHEWVKYITRANEIAERQAIALDRIAERLHEVLNVPPVTFVPLK